MSTSTIVVLGIITVYLLVCIALGYLAYRRRVVSTRDFFTAAGTISPLILMATYVATQFSSYTFLGGAGWFFDANVAPGVFELGAIVVSPWAIIIGLRIYKIVVVHKMVTPADFLSARFGSRMMRIVAAVVVGLIICFAFNIFYVSVQLVGSAYTLSGLTLGELSYRSVLIYFAIGMCIYTAIGGFRAVAYTDALQLGLCFFLLLGVGYIAVSQHGGLPQLFSDAVAARPTAFEYPYPPQWIGLCALTAWLPYLSMPHMYVRFYAASDLKGVMYMITGCAIGGTIMMVIMSTIIGSGISAFAPQGLEGVPADQLPVQWLLHYMGPVVAALLLSGAVAASFSTADSILLLAASAIMHDFFESTLRVPWSIATKLWVSRAIVVVMIGTGFWGALNPGAHIITTVMSLTYPAYAILTPCVLACFWKRATKWGILAGLTVGSVAAVAICFGGLASPFGVWEGTWIAVWVAIAVVVFSLLTPHPPYEESWERFKLGILAENK